MVSDAVLFQIASVLPTDTAHLPFLTVFPLGVLDRLPLHVHFVIHSPSTQWNDMVDHVAWAGEFGTSRCRTWLSFHKRMTSCCTAGLFALGWQAGYADNYRNSYRQKPLLPKR
jgi:hypothetical protein